MTFLVFSYSLCNANSLKATNAPKPIMMLERAGSNLLEFFSWYAFILQLCCISH